MQRSTVLVFIDTSKAYFARYSGKTRTHAYAADSHVTPEWVEALRTHPETWEPDVEPEVA